MKTSARSIVKKRQKIKKYNQPSIQLWKFREKKDMRGMSWRMCSQELSSSLLHSPSLSTLSLSFFLFLFLFLFHPLKLYIGN